jgi:hypothetical protein
MSNSTLTGNTFKSNVALFWDIENVTPSANDTLFLEGIFDYTESLGRVVASFAYAEWGKAGFNKLDKILAKRRFKLIHTPHRHSGKNSADMQLVGDALELLQFYNHIDSYVLISGDSDFRPLLTTLRKSGKQLYIICDTKTAAQDLLELADDFKDYRDLAPSSDDEEEEQAVHHPKSYWFERLAEAVAFQTKQNKSLSFGAIKIRLKTLNPDFDENSLKFKRFSHFVMAAKNEGYIDIRHIDDERRLIEVGKKAKDEQNDSLQEALNALIDHLQKLDNGRKEPGFHHFPNIGSELRSLYHIDFEKIGFPKFKRFMQLAEKRDIIEIKSDIVASNLSARLKTSNTIL